MKGERTNKREQTKPDHRIDLMMLFRDKKGGVEDRISEVFYRYNVGH